jgi:hypothetical protein
MKRFHDLLMNDNMMMLPFVACCLLVALMCVREVLK